MKPLLTRRDRKLLLNVLALAAYATCVMAATMLVSDPAIDWRALLTPTSAVKNPVAAPAANREPSVKIAERAPAPVIDEAVLTLLPPVDSRDVRTLIKDGRVLQLAGLEGPQRDDACPAGDGTRWACGLQSWVALYNMIKGKRLDCRLTGAPQGEIEPIQCVMDGEDLARQIVRAGWARPDDPGPYADDAVKMRAAKTGVWRGWTGRAAAAAQP